ncbi:acetyl-CoA carboxylase biotin carboxyl carrier protein subunit [Orrella sp. 11846]|uniref:acetyl-CoA carboxylase biotin carboxyl carrier protein subunit n=1 Tax=Orrella sp. 11846 TaxID=3409913 RepID=UPI003B5C5EE5
MEKVEATVAGRILSIEVKVGDTISIEDEVVMIESMKMELPVASEYDGTVTKICVNVGDEVEEGDVLMELGD